MSAETKISTREKIENALKAAGINRRQVSIREPRSGYDRCFELTIRDPKFEVEYIESLVSGFQRVYRCEASGEILSGGNIWIDVSATDEVLDTWASEYLDQVTEAMSLLTSDHGERVGNCSIHEQNAYCVKVWSDKPGSRGWLNYNFPKTSLKQIALAVRDCNK